MCATMQPMKCKRLFFLLRAFAQFLEKRAAAMLSLVENLKNHANNKELMQKSQKKFSQKSLGEN